MFLNQNTLRIPESVLYYIVLARAAFQASPANFLQKN